ncbi:MAG TPA: gliding motility-associated C-terminal domain-containing protein [Bacteroidia bacterium]|nr:gliding motility-associated C-terminal domain-containing protein [Bacteroidia bacterium]
MRILLSGFAVLLLLPQQSKATHAAGADLTYTCLGGLVYQVDATFYRDCSGSNEPPTVTIRYGSASCGYSMSAVANKISGPNGIEITMPCAGMPTTCNGGVSTGLRKWMYRAVITLPFACSDWVFSYKVCCRNCTITTILNPCATGSEIYVESRLNNIAAPCNSSPYFNNSPIAFMPIGQPFNYNQGVTDSDGDSLVYELVTPMTGPVDSITWLPPSTTLTPLASSTPFIINQLTGDICFTPSQIQIGVLSIRVSEFRDGLKIGSTMRDLQVYTYNSFNIVPTASGINGTTSNSINACPGQQICFTVQTADADSAQALSVAISNTIPGAVITTGAGPRPVVQFCWIPDTSRISIRPWVFTLTVRDDACPVNGVQTYSYAIFVGRSDVTAQVITNACGSGANGSASVQVQPVPAQSVVWNTNPPQQAALATQLTAGIYTVTVTDAFGCVINDSVQIASSPVPVVSSTVTPLTCSGTCSGTITTSLTNGTPPYTYHWSNGQTTQQATNLCSGLYTLTVNDAEGCSITDAQLVPAASNVVVTGIVSQPVCGDTTGGNIDLQVSGGVPPYSFLWSNGYTSEDLSNLPAGNYQVAVTDSSGCTVNTSFSIAPFATNINVIPTVQNVSCYGESSGSISLQLPGSGGPYTCIWSNGMSGNNITGLPSGVYTYIVAGPTGCSVTATLEVKGPGQPLLATTDITQIISCFEGSDGSITVLATGGNEGYQYNWSNGSTSQTISGLAAGTYTVTVTDSMGCKIDLVQNILSPSSAITSHSKIDYPECIKGTKGTIQLMVAGGNPGYLYNWSNGAVTVGQGNLEPGLYTVTITDMAGCTVQQSFNLNDRSHVALLTPGTIDICNGSMAVLTVDSTYLNATYQWYYSGSQLLGAVAAELETPAAGFYYVMVTSACGNYYSDSVLVKTHSLTNVSVSPNQVICPPETAQLTASGGKEYSWKPEINLNNSAISNPVAAPVRSTVYTVLIKDEIGCSIELPVSITVDCDSLFVPNGFSPNADGINDGFVIPGIEKYPDNKLWVYDRWGTLVFKAKNYNNKWNGESNIRGNMMGQRLLSGTYFYILDLGDNQPPTSGYVVIRF